MSEPRSTLVTVDEFARLPEDETRVFELIDGVIYTAPRPRPRHGYAHLALGHRLGGPFHLDAGGPGGWWFLPEPLLRWSDYDATAPDLAGWRRERVPELPEEFPIAVRPDWVCEILSPSTSRRDRTVKMEIHARCEVPWQWIVDPAIRTLEAFRNQGGRWLRIGAWGEGDVARIVPFEAVALDIGALFVARKGPPGVEEEAAVTAWP